MPPGERAVLAASIQFNGCGRDQLSVLTGYKRSSRDAYIARLKDKGLVVVDGDRIVPTDAGRDMAPEIEPLPVGLALQEFWRGRLPEGERKVLDILIAGYPNAVRREDIDDATGYKRSSRDAYLARLKSRRLVEISGREIRASDDLFEESA